MAPAASRQASRRRLLEGRETQALSQERVDDAVERARLRRMVEQPGGERISDEVIDQLLAGARTEEEIAGPGGLLAQLTKRLVERAMEVELTDHLGYEPHQEPPGGTGNTRNGTSPKTLVTEQGKVPLDAPRDRDGSFEPKIVRKRQRRFEGFDEKILALYSRGLSTRDIEAHLEEIYGVKVGRELISKVTDGVMDDVRAWASRPLEDVYPVIFLDALVLKIREGGTVGRRACYLALGDHARGRPRRPRPVVPGNRGRQILDAGAVRAQAARRQRHPDLLRRRAQRFPGGDRGDLPQDDRPNVHRAPHPPFLEIRAPPGARASRPGPEADLHRRSTQTPPSRSSSASTRSGAPASRSSPRRG